MEWAFRGPATLRDRLGGTSTARRSRRCRPTTSKRCSGRSPRCTATRVRWRSARTRCATHIVEEYDGDAGRDLDTASTTRRCCSTASARCPGYGEEKAKIFLAILGKRLQVAPKGWEEYAAPFSDANPRSVADIDSPEALQRVRAWKQEQKAKGKGKAD